MSKTIGATLGHDPAVPIGSPLPLAVASGGLAPEASATEKRLGWFFWFCVGWIVLVTLAAIFANLLPIADPNAQPLGVHAVKCAAGALRAGAMYRIRPGTGRACALNLDNLGPSAAHWLGTDDLGRDILSRLIYGARVSLIVGFGAIGIGLAVGGTAGMYAAYRRGITDTLLSAASYVLLAFPPLVAVIAIITFWHPVSTWKITVIIGIASTPLLFRIMRASCLSYATRDFVMASKALGARDWRVLTREILPNVAPAAMSFGLIGVATVIVLEGSLAFLGLSVAPPTPSWGNMLNEGSSSLLNNANPWLTLFPALAMFLFLLALNLVGDKLRQHFDVAEVKL